MSSIENKEKGALEIELLALLIVLGLIISATTSFQNTIKTRKISTQYLKTQLESFQCFDQNKITCKTARRRFKKSLKLCNSLIESEKCSYIVETQE